MIKVRDLHFGETLFRSIEKMSWDYGSRYKEVFIPTYLSVIKKELPVFIDKKD